VIAVFSLLSYNHCMASECDRITEEATKLHWDYVNDENNVTLTMSYNMTAKMNEICRLD